VKAQKPSFIPDPLNKNALSANSREALIIHFERERSRFVRARNGCRENASQAIPSYAREHFCSSREEVGHICEAAAKSAIP
jgi:hypothetical protein